MIEDFYAIRRRLEAKRVIELPKPIGWQRETTYPLANPPAHPDADPYDSRPSRQPYPDAAPDLSTRPGNPTDIDVHVRAFHAAQRAAHEDAILFEGGDVSRLPNLKRAILEAQALHAELGTAPVLPSSQSERYLNADGPEPEALA